MLMNECNDVLIRNVTLPASNTTTNSTSNSTQEVIIPAIVEEIGQLLCPNDCAFNGKCVNGSCICNKDYTAEDCSISLYQVPDISRLVLFCFCESRFSSKPNANFILFSCSALSPVSAGHLLSLSFCIFFYQHQVIITFASNGELALFLQCKGHV